MDGVNEDGSWSRANTVNESDIQDGYIYDLVIQARSSDGIFKEVVYKFISGYPDPFTPYTANLEEDGEDLYFAAL